MTSMQADATLAVLELVKGLQKVTCSEAGPGWNILDSIRQRLSEEYRNYLTKEVK